MRENENFYTRTIGSSQDFPGQNKTEGYRAMIVVQATVVTRTGVERLVSVLAMGA